MSSCGTSREILEKRHWLDGNKCCMVKLAGNEICGRPFVEHPSSLPEAGTVSEIGFFLPLQDCAPLQDDIYGRVNMRDDKASAFPHDNKSCITIRARIFHSPSGVRKELAHDLVAMGIGHGFIQRIAAAEVQVFLALPNLQNIDLGIFAFYFGVKWAVTAEDYEVQRNNVTDVDYLNRGFVVHTSAVAGPDDCSQEEDLDSLSVGGYSVVSDVSC